MNKLFTPTSHVYSHTFVYIAIHLSCTPFHSTLRILGLLVQTASNWVLLLTSYSLNCIILYHYYLYLSLCVSTYHLFILLVSQTTWEAKCEFKLGQKLVSTSLLIKWRWQQLFLRCVSFKWACGKGLTYFCLHLLFGFLIYLMVFFFSCCITVFRTMLRIYQMFNFYVGLDYTREITQWSCLEENGHFFFVFALLFCEEFL